MYDGQLYISRTQKYWIRPILNYIKPAFTNDGNIVSSRAANQLSSMGIDQCHEQLNKLVKGDGGAIGLIKNKDELKKWIVCGLEVPHIVREFEENPALRGTQK